MKKILIILLLLYSKLSFSYVIPVPPCPKEMPLRLWRNEETSECVSHCPNDYPIQYNSECFSIKDPYILKISETECKKYPERFYLSDNNSVAKRKDGFWETKLYPTESGCYLRPDRDRPLLRVDLTKKIKTSGKNRNLEILSFDEDYGSRNLYFYRCSENIAISTLPEFCDRCSNRKYEDGICMLKECFPNHFRRGDNYCESCGYIYARQTTKEECDKCSNRIFDTVSQNCLNCDSDDVFENISSDNCLKCGNRLFIDGKCILNKECPKGMKLERGKYCNPIIPVGDRSNKNECKQAPGYFWGIDEYGKERCETCNRLDAISATRESCEHCSNRSYINGKCVLNTRPIHDIDSHIQQSDRTWKRCAANTINNTTSSECDRCNYHIFFPKDNTCRFCSNHLTQDECKEQSNQWKTWIYDSDLGLCCLDK